MNCKINKISFFIIVGILIFIGDVFAKDIAEGLKSVISSFGQAKDGMSMWQMIQAGGFIMYILLFVSVVTSALIIYNFTAINVKKLLPENFAKDVIQNLEQRNEKAILKLCSEQQNMFATVISSGLGLRSGVKQAAKEKMEKSADKEMAELWRNISYLADIASIAPLIGLLGTVLGMIQAFNVIAFQTAVVKPILLAGGVSKAMVTTAGGLIVAIPASIFYSYFRGKLLEIGSIVENYIDDIMGAMD